MTFIPLGDLVLARGHLEKSLALYDPQQHRSHAVRYGLDPKVGGLTRLAEALWHLGYPDQSRRKNQEALALARELAHPFSLAYALSFAGQLHQCRREPQLVRERAEATIGLATEQGFPFWRAWGIVLQIWALAEEGQKEEKNARLQQGMVVGRAMPKGFTPLFFALLSEAYGQGEQPEVGLTLIDEALTAVNQTENRVREAEIYRLKGKLTLQKQWKGKSGKSKDTGGKSKVSNPQSLTPNPQAEAEACFLKAIEVARKQQAKSWELRATTSLARLWQSQGKQREAHAILSNVYNWFTEGFDTKDLQEAKALIEELSH